MELTFTAATDTWTMQGDVSVSIVGLGSMSATLGYDGGPGMVISNGTLEVFDLTVNGSFDIPDVVDIYANNLQFKYLASTGAFTMSGRRGGLPPGRRVQLLRRHDRRRNSATTVNRAWSSPAAR